MSDSPPSVEGYDSADATFNEALQIDMKGLFGDTVGNMSISPTSRDVVLAGRKGLFIIDLNAPLEIPRFLPQGGTWDVADVQWNPHVSHAQYIVSTSNEKLLIWNLLLDGKAAIEHVLHAHSRAITDINWHTTDPNQVVSSGIDGWLWGWDIRRTNKPVLGLCAFNEAATQVKWNRQNEHILASSHADDVLIWDRRKGSLPISRINAHSAKIYGIDWSHEKRTEILSCSLDRTIKLWDVETVVDTNEPKVKFNTSYPVWRARDLPFGRGVLSLPQRGENVLDMWSYDHPEAPVSVLEGHSDTVKEFVWRRGGTDYNDFRLITWSKDKTLRFCPINFDEIPHLSRKECPPNPLSFSDISETSQTSYRTISHPENRAPPLSAPFGYILSEVRAPPPSRRPQVIYPLPSGGYERVKGRSFSRVRRQTVMMGAIRGGTMSRGGRSARMDPLAWWSSVKVRDRREGSSEPGSGIESGDISRVQSTSRRNSQSSHYERGGFFGRRNEAFAVESEDESKENEFGQSLQDEITAVISKLSQHKVRLEKHDLTKKRAVTMGLTGPWGESSSVFIRVTFTFPKDYPSSQGPSGTPTIDLERNTLISLNDRAFMLRRLRVIRESHRPCLEACLRFLLFGNEGERIMRSSGSSDIEDFSHNHGDTSGHKVSSAQKDEAAYSQLRNDKTLAEPRTSQGVFGPNGELICFFRAPPRIVRNPLHEMSASPSLRAQETAPRLFRAPASLSDAINRLTVASNDRTQSNTSRRTEDAANILRIMTNLLTFSQGKRRRVSERSKPANDDVPYALLPPRRSTVFIKPAASIGHPDRAIASQYKVDMTKPGESCRTNAAIAKQHGRHDHERVFKTLEILTECYSVQPPTQGRQRRILGTPGTKLARNIYAELCLEKDVQILAMASIFILHCEQMLQEAQNAIQMAINPPRSAPTRPSRRKEARSFSTTHNWYQAQPSSGIRRMSATTNTPSSRGSWSSLFNTGGVRQFMAGGQNSPDTASPGATDVGLPERLPVSEAMKPKEPSRALSQSPLKRGVAKSWSESSHVQRNSPATGTRRPTLSESSSAEKVERALINKKLVVAIALRDNNSVQQDRITGWHEQMVMHVNAYAELLFRWQLLKQRAELLNSIKDQTQDCREHLLGISTVGDPRSAEMRSQTVRCTFCHLPIKGLSFACVRCGHVMHLRCRNVNQHLACAAGCGCICGNGGLGSADDISRGVPQYFLANDK